MNYIGITPQGKEILLAAPASAKLVRSEDAPADGFSGVFPLLKNTENLVGLRIYDRNKALWFDGIVDEQKESLGAGRTLTLIARSRAALLLDNEALPQTYRMPSLQTVFQRHIQPYGFQVYLGDNRVFSEELIISKGMSEWQAAEEFCIRFLRVKPRMLGNIFDASGRSTQKSVYFDNDGGIRYSSAVIDYRYYKLYSEVMVKSGESNLYAVGARGTEAAALGIRRRRYLSGGQNAEAVAAAAARKAFQAEITCPGEFTAEIGTGAVLHDAQLGTLQELAVSQIAYSLNESGEKSTVTLRRG